ncbi:MAG: carbohydrate kinase family protein [Anaerolineales bacterium]|nr:carbohydrate kinase family protein [Anaerolineales bacterium]MCX7753819.1 carbohydrate kinase family protein [Anaerolineales bacterium]MDW8276415.1 carbohydrate kinase family protein [Anaerolineales bacterium]
MGVSLVIAGQLRRQYLLPPAGKPLLDTPGGNLLYAAAGARLWTNSVSLLARVGEDYPTEWLRQFRQRGIDTRGVKILPSPLDLRSFLVYTEDHTVQRSNPVSHFARLGLPFPKGLLGYQAPPEEQEDRLRARPDSPKLSDIPIEYRAAKAVHLAPLDLLTHSQLSAAFRHSGSSYVTMDPSPGYMNGKYLDDLRSLLQGLTAFLPSEEEIRSLFWGRTNDLWEMAETLASFGCDIIVIKRGARGQCVYDRVSNRKWEIPAYPANFVDPTGAGDAFCGGFLAGYAATLDPLQAALYGNISASFAIEGSGPFYLLDSMPGLAQARLASLADLVRPA